MAKFRFEGEIPGSKSIFNRALIVQSFFPELKLQGYSGCDDVRHMREGVQLLSSQSDIDVGEGGTTFRFLALRASRIPGRHVLSGSKRLFLRPQKGLLNLLQQLGVKVEVTEDCWVITSEGWKIPQSPLQVAIAESSQYASALLLNSWRLNQDLTFEIIGDKLSESYFFLTLEMVSSLGMEVVKSDNGYRIPRGQRVNKFEYYVEPDMSSAFTMAAVGALSQGARLLNFPSQSHQPDFSFIKLLRQMNVSLRHEQNELAVEPATDLHAVDWDLSQSPDLFPVLAVLCSWASGISRLYGAPHLVGKESNRIAKVAELLSLVGVRHEPQVDGMIIHGDPAQKPVKDVLFNPDQDHRMVMAAVLMNLKGHNIHVENPEVINKSFPEFWKMVGFK